MVVQILLRWFEWNTWAHTLESWECLIHFLVRSFMLNPCVLNVLPYLYLWEAKIGISWLSRILNALYALFASKLDTLDETLENVFYMVIVLISHLGLSVFRLLDFVLVSMLDFPLWTLRAYFWFCMRTCKKLSVGEFDK